MKCPRCKKALTEEEIRDMSVAMMEYLNANGVWSAEGKPQGKPAAQKRTVSPLMAQILFAALMTAFVCGQFESAICVAGVPSR